MSDTRDESQTPEAPPEATPEATPEEATPKGKVRLTMKAIEKMTTTRPGGVRVYEGHGFCVQVMPSGHKSYMLDYTSPTTRQRRRLKLGTTEDMNLSQARDAVRDARQKIRKGIDPQDERDQERAAGTFGQWVDRYIEIGKADQRWTPRTRDSVRSILAKASAAFGKKPLASVSARDVEILRDERHRSAGLAAANTMIATVRACLTEAWRHGLVPGNEAAKVKRIAGQTPRTRVLSEEEMKRLVVAVEAHPDPQFKVAMLWLIMTGARKSEVLGATWPNVRLDPPARAEWTVPKPKNRRPSVRPLPEPLAREIFSLPRTDARICPISDTEFARRWTALRKAAKLPDDVHTHDLRRTAGLWITRAAGLQTAQRLLGHATIATTAAVYSPLTTEDLRGPQAEVVGKVLAFRRKASGEED